MLQAGEVRIVYGLAFGDLIAQCFQLLCGFGGVLAQCVEGFIRLVRHRVECGRGLVERGVYGAGDALAGRG